MDKGHTIKCLDHGHVIYVDHMGSDNAICQAARVSYNRAQTPVEVEKDQRLIYRLYRDRHTSPFEMGKIVFNIKSPIFIERQRVRHRMQNMNEVSARYTELQDVFYVPDFFRPQDPKNRQGSVEGRLVTAPFKIPVLDTDGSVYQTDSLSQIVHDHSRRAYLLYKALLECGVSREQARMVLPLNVYTEVRCCVDMKNLLDFIRLREDAHAQAEIQEYARAMKTIATALFPMVMAAYERYKFTVTDTQPA